MIIWKINALILLLVFEKVQRFIGSLKTLIVNHDWKMEKCFRLEQESYTNFYGSFKKPLTD